MASSRYYNGRLCSPGRRQQCESGAQHAFVVSQLILLLLALLSRLCSIPRLARTIHRLQASLEGKGAGLASSTALGKRRRNLLESDRGSPSPSSSATEIGQSVPLRRTPSVEVLVWDIVVDQLLCEDPSLASLIHEEGDPSPCEADESPQRIRLMDSRASNPSKVAPKYSVTEKMYKESRKWWEECAVSCGFRGWGVD